VIKSGSTITEPTLAIQKKIFALQDSDKSTDYHMFHGPVKTTGQTERSILIYREATPTEVPNGYDHTFKSNVQLYTHSRNYVPIDER
jgi:hypothetical protein